MKHIIEAQRAFFNTNHTKPVEFRRAQLETLKSLIQRNETALEEAIDADYGKGRFNTFITELYVVYDEIDVALRQLPDWTRHRPVATDLLNSPGQSYIVPEPLGVSLVIGPWNYPYQLTLTPIVAAIAAGCTVVLKPSELTPHSSGLIARLLREAFDPRFLAVVEGGIPETTALLAEKFDVIFFTGSVPVGKIVYQAAAKHLTPVILELGGKSPAIVEADARLDVAVRRLVWAKFLNAGQTCIAPDYLCVHRSVERQVLDRIAEELARIGYDVASGNYARIVDRRNAARIVGLIEPDKVLLGGEHDVDARIIVPTVVRADWDDAVMQEEIFGPVLPVLVYDTIDDVVDRIKARPKPLALYLFTESEAIKDKVLTEVSFGGGCINDALMHVANGDLPFGGVGDSGTGSYHREAGFRAFSHFKSVLDRPFVDDPDLKYPPHTEEKLAMLKAVTGMTSAAADEAGAGHAR
ncbi:aldehyde dehydrogenase family protein [Luteimonas sp. BDR2-5]|uniref:aldehyde dehydrogenase family protein n=1 Tax=Proluteimonas luteida TaxID=2878685 RepID=UPI001E52CD23|nr:aldehyde dehydrogenase family protein [Luteimonas sp. BDR2-5]MCD9026800.1 aldehyde dehydrogenase family protein [Luteimonas sp. BDR2-5]